MKNHALCASLCAGALILATASLPALRAAEAAKGAMEPRISVVTLGVADLQASYKFYKDGLGFPTSMTPDGGIVLFATSGTRLFLYPYAKLAQDLGVNAAPPNPKDRFPGFTFIHVVRRPTDVAAVLAQAEKAKGRIIKKAAPTSFGGVSGHFADPDGYIWEVTYSDQMRFNADGTLIVE